MIWWGVFSALVILVTVIVALRNERLREKYAILWIVLSLAVLIISLFPSILDSAAKVLGVNLPSNLFFALAIALLALINLHLTWEQSSTDKQIRKLSEEIAILKGDFEDPVDSTTPRSTGRSPSGKEGKSK